MTQTPSLIKGNLFSVIPTYEQGSRVYEKRWILVFTGMTEGEGAGMTSPFRHPRESEGPYPRHPRESEGPDSEILELKLLFHFEYLIFDII